MKKIFEWTKKWAAVILLTMWIIGLICTALCCIFSKGKVYPIIGGCAIVPAIASLVYQLIVEYKRIKGGQ